MLNSIELQVNGKKFTIHSEPERSLLEALRDDLQLTAAKYGCGEGQCGACTVVIDGRARRSCLTAVSEAAGKKITTIEGLEKNGRLHPVQEAFLKMDAMQCGYCTPGMIMSAVALLERVPKPSREEIIRFMEGNICRCCTYSRIIAAIQAASKSGEQQ